MLYSQVKLTFMLMLIVLSLVSVCACSTYGSAFEVSARSLVAADKLARSYVFKIKRDKRAYSQLSGLVKVP